MAKNILVFTRGDTYKFNIEITDPDFPRLRYFLNESDLIYLGIMTPHQPFEEAMIKLVFTKENQDEEGNILVKLDPDLTEQIRPGVYYYSVKLRQNAGTDDERVTTIINKTRIVIND